MRQVVLDTETTGLEADQGHRVIELGCVEVIDRRVTRKHYHQYVNPERDIDDGALEVHGITRQFLSEKPVFGDSVEAFVNFISGSELVIHNAAFDIEFLNLELKLVGRRPIEEICSVVDSLEVARRKHPGQRNSLDALCKRYSVDNTQRELHGALLDAEILAEVYLQLTGGQVALALGDGTDANAGSEVRRLSAERPRLRVIHASDDELQSHAARLVALETSSDDGCAWTMLDAPREAQS